MLSPDRRFLIFHTGFWLVGGLALFVSGLSQMPWDHALVRNIFLPIAGFLTAFALLPLIEAGRARSPLAQRVAALVAAYGVALFCVLVINAISYAQKGMAFEAVTFGQWFSGGMNFYLVLAFWAELTIQRVWDSDRPRRQTLGSASGSLVLTDRGKVLPVALGEVTHVTAAGDYVEVYLRSRDRPVVERRTLSSLVEHLPASSFLRVHRGAIVNCDHVTSLEPLTKGRCRLALEGGATVESSRGYREAIGARFAPPQR